MTVRRTSTREAYVYVYSSGRNLEATYEYAGQGAGRAGFP
jgi:hypothetical protein